MEGLLRLVFGILAPLVLALGLVLLSIRALPAWHQVRHTTEASQAFAGPSIGLTYRDAGSSYWFGRPKE
jgi:hypothetical protein